MSDHFHDECGVFGIFDHPEAARLTYLGLYALQHRGQESAGIVSSDYNHLSVERGMGYVADVFTEQRMSRLPGHAAIGHVRYSTSGSSNLHNAQPISIESWRGPLAIGHNGNLLNAGSLRYQLERDGAIFQTNSDTEVILHLIARSRQDALEDAIREALTLVTGAFSLVLISPTQIFAIRDPNGFRPLCIGKLGDSTVFASETCALDLIEAEYIRDIQPGEIVKAELGQPLACRMLPERSVRPSQCIFELVYFARPDSQVFGRGVNDARYKMGYKLAREHPVDADIVVPVPDSGVPASIGFADGSGIPLQFGLIRNHYIGRTFIEPKQSIRHFGVRIKLNPVRDLLKGKRVVLIDDSIVRGTTSRKIVNMVRSSGAREVHVRISSPPTVGPCYFGIDTPTKEELIASSHSVEEIRSFIEADSLGYLSMAGLKAAVGDRDDFCSGCFTGNYPIQIETDKTQKKLFV
ncbi:MAG: amidophosphoribosyltransferase [Acidobacteriota bacterium]